jgi:hypothetical protein
MVSKKDKRNSGRVEGRLLGKNSIKIEEGIESTIFWDDWVDYRDGFRFNKDRKHLFKCVPFVLDKDKIKKINKKLKKQIKIRKAKKLKKDKFVIN